MKRRIESIMVRNRCRLSMMEAVLNGIWVYGKYVLKNIEFSTYLRRKIPKKT